MKKYQIIYADPPWQFKNYNDKKAKNWVNPSINPNGLSCKFKLRSGINIRQTDDWRLE